MKNIVYCRVDDRLVHGQVMTAWTVYTNTTKVLVVDNKVVNDPFMSMVMKSAMPSKISLEVMSVSQAISHLKEDGSEDERYFLLAKTPMAFKELSDAGVDIKEVGIGGIGARADRKKLYKNIAATDEEKQTIKSMLDKGLDVYIRVVPDDKRVELQGLLEG